VTMDELAKIKKNVEGEVQAAIKFAVDSKYADPAEDYKYFRDNYGA